MTYSMGLGRGASGSNKVKNVRLLTLTASSISNVTY
ncbi:hypothetical protein ACVW1B_001062 [Bradyrhizobium sp. USDA 4502]